MRSSTVGVPFAPGAMLPASVNCDRSVCTSKRSKNQPPGPRPNRPLSGLTERSGAWPIQDTRVKSSDQRTGTYVNEKNAFSGADKLRKGKIEYANGGTLFLDEIGDLPLDVQPKLLRFLEQSEIMPIGETRPQRVDVRVLAATNADLEQRVAEGKFREDLYYRLNVIRIHVPPLRERREEIPHLSTYFLREALERLGKPDIQLSSEALDVFSQYWWPGNVRQLKNEIQRAVALSAPG